MNAVRAKMREIWGSAIYRGVLLLVFLVVAFSEFPNHKLSIGLGALLILHTIAAVGLAVSQAFLIANHTDDLAERKTRHAIVLAAQQGRDAGDYDFWATVDARVADELREAGKIEEPSRLGRIVWHVMGRAISDYAILAVAWFLAS